MNTIHALAHVDLWQLAGWTMLHFLWLGALAGLAAGVCRLALFRASANVRYATAVACFALLAALPILIGSWLVSHDTIPALTIEPAALIEQAGQASKLIEIGTNEINPSAPGFVGDVSQHAIDSGAAIQPTLSIDPHPGRGLTGLIPNTTIERSVAILESCTRYLPWIWLAGTPLTFALLASGFVGAERLRRRSRVIDDAPISETCVRLASALRISRSVTVAVCERIAAPVLVGVLRPIILLPPAALTGWSPDEIEMVLLHELAHVRRWDNLVNLAQRLVESLLFFHPAVWLVSRWVRRERELCCDAVVVGRTNRPHAYAEMLVALAAQMPRSVLFHPAATSAMAHGPLRGRIRRILQLEDDPMLVSGKSLVIVMSGLLLAATLVVLNLPTRGQAEESFAESSDSKENAAVAVPFVEGKSHFKDGDKITITKVRGTAAEFKPGGIYWIEGTYTLSSEPRSNLSVFTTAKEAANALSPISKEQTTSVERGHGTFHLRLSMSSRGWPHVSFYPKDGGESFGGVYFGTSDSVLNDTDSGVQRAQSQNNLKDLALALLNLESAKHQFPAVAKFDNSGKPLLSWRVLILPYLGDDEAKLFKEFHLDEPWDSEHNKQLIARMPKAFKHPRIERPGFTNYLAVLGRECMFTGTSQGIRLAQVTDGTSRTIALVEADADRAVEWTKPQDWEFNRQQPTAGLGSFWPGYWYAAWVDGSIHGVENSQAADEVGIQFTRAGGEEKTLSESADIASATVGDTPTNDATLLVGDMATTVTTSPAHAASSKFPSLDDQKLADLAFRQLNIELEPLDEQDLQRVKALGYGGGLFVSRGNGSPVNSNTIHGGDILVGLHVWPTTSLKDVAAILSRDDLAELTPLKFYVVRNSQGFGDSRPDAVATGRIDISTPTKLRQNTGGDTFSAVPQWPDSSAEPVTDQSRHSAPANSQPWGVVGLQPETPYTAPPNATPRRIIESRVFPLPADMSDADTQRAAKELTGKHGFRNAAVIRTGDGQRLMSVEVERTPDEPRTPQLNWVKDGQGEWHSTVSFVTPSPSPAPATPALQPTAAREGARATSAYSEPTLATPDNQFQDFTAPLGAVPVTRIAPAGEPAPGKPVLYYDGKTFNEWRCNWQTELSTDQRLQAVKALAAFARAGYGKEATDSILDVAGEYDFPILDDSDEGRFKEAVLQVLAPNNQRQSLIKLWLPNLTLRFEKDPTKWKWLTLMLLDRTRTDDPESIAILESIAESGPADLRDPAIAVLVHSSPTRDGQVELNDKTRNLLADALTSGDPARIHAASQLLVSSSSGFGGGGDAPKHVLTIQPVLTPLLFDDAEPIRREARWAMHFLREDDVPKVLPQLLAALHDESQQEKRIAAIRALAAIGVPAASAKDDLWPLLKNSDEATVVAATNALLELANVDLRERSRANPPASDLLQMQVRGVAETLGPERQEEFVQVFSRFAPQIVREANEILPPESVSEYRGGGMF